MTCLTSLIPIRQLLKDTASAETLKQHKESKHQSDKVSFQLDFFGEV